MASLVRTAILVVVIYAVCERTVGHKTFSKEELNRELDEIERELKVYLRETDIEAEDQINAAITTGKKQEVEFKRKQKKFKEAGIDGKKNKKRRGRLSKIGPNFIEQQDKGVTMMEIKKALVQSTGKSIRKLGSDAAYKEKWNQLVPQITIDTEKRSIGKRHRKYKRTTDTSVCDSTSVTCSDLENVDNYRTFNGLCNNKNNPLWGSAESTQRRFLDEVYADSISTERVSLLDGSALPNPREISNAIFNATEPTEAETFNTLISLNWGQFLDHDIVLTPEYTGDDGAVITCCPEDTSRTECMAIIMTPDNDLDTDCMEFVRSAPSADCDLVGKQVTNSITSFIDASNVYGSTEDESESLRTSGGYLTTITSTDEKGLLPEDTDDDAICFKDDLDSETSDYCQLAGDVRVNVQPGLAHLHLLFVREHNRIVDELKAINPSWSDDKLYNETRKIVGALVQHITFNEYFGNLFSDDMITTYDLSLQESGYSTDYDETVDPSILVEFSTAAYRFGHSQIPDKLAYMGTDYTSTSEETDMENTLKNPHMLVADVGAHIIELTRYMSTIAASKADEEFESSIRNTLFNSKLDLPSLNIQRGRDHGLPTYTQMREYCGLSIPAADDHTSWRDLTDLRGTSRQALKELYKSVHDIDLYAGGMGEKRAGGYLGETFACIIGLQFQYLKKGDRFWYEREHTDGFTTEQLTEIRKVTLSGLMCENFGLDEMQGNAFKQPNNRRSCTRFDQMDFTPWLDETK